MDKRTLLADRRFKDARDKDAASRDGAGDEPMSWDARSAPLVEEILHHFRPKVLIISALCPSLAAVTMNAEVPIMAL